MPRIKKKGKPAPEVVLRSEDVALPEISARGRVSSYSEEKAKRVCDLIASGKSLRTIAKENADLPAPSTFLEWCYKNRGLAEQYAQARASLMETYAEQIMDIADATDAQNVNVARLQVDTRKWLMSKLAPRTYGDRMTLAGDSNAPLVIAWAGDDTTNMIDITAEDIPEVK